MKKSIISFVLVMLIIIGLACSLLFGLTIGGKTLIPAINDSENGIRLGLDLVGGSSITFEAQLPDGYDTENLGADMEVAQTMLRQRLTQKGFTEATVTLKGDKQLTVEIPEITNPEEAVQTLGTTAQLMFADADGKVWLTGDQIASAAAREGYLSDAALVQEHYVELQFTSEGQALFAEATAQVAAREDGYNYLLIIMDNEVISSPSVQEQINSDSCVISGSFTQESAKELADLISVGQMPFSLSQVELRSVGPQLGQDALKTSMLAAMIGIAVVCLFMILVYRIPGFVACVALGFYIVIEFVLFGWLRVNLSLPSIAGIVLSVGMAVDANVVIFERIKEELREGKTVKSAIDSGFKRAFTAVLDSNVTTLICAVVLFFMGTGTIVGFATTLGIGVIVSMFTAITVTRFLLNRAVDFHIRNPKAYGA